MGSLINGARCIHEIKSKIAVTKAAFNNKRALFATNLDLNFWKKLIKCYILSIPFRVVETWTLRDVDRNTRKVLRYCAGERR
jgi:accessory gene regulator protein AgrB